MHAFDPAGVLVVELPQRFVGIARKVEGRDTRRRTSKVRSIISAKPMIRWASRQATVVTGSRPLAGSP